MWSLSSRLGAQAEHSGACYNPNTADKVSCWPACIAEWESSRLLRTCLKNKPDGSWGTNQDCLLSSTHKHVHLHMCNFPYKHTYIWAQAYNTVTTVFCQTWCPTPVILALEVKAGELLWVSLVCIVRPWLTTRTQQQQQEVRLLLQRGLRNHVLSVRWLL